MTSFWQAPALVLVVVTWLTTPPASIGDAARREALRRQLTPKSTASLSNFGLPPEPEPAAVVSVPPPAAEPPPPGAPAAPSPASEPKRDEKWWRARIAAARAAFERDEVLTDAMQSRINALQTDVVNRDDPAQQALLRQQLGKALGEFERLKNQLDADRKAIADIQAEARRQGVPPGWTR